MNKDAVVAPPGKAEHPEHHAFCAATGTSAGCRDNSDAAESGCLQLLPIEELVPLSQTLISPALARLLKTQPRPLVPAHGSCPQSVAEEFFRSDHAELRNMQQFAEDDRVRIIGDGDHLKHNAEDPYRIHIPRANGPLIFQEVNGDLTGTGGSCKRSRLSAGLLDSYGMQLSDGDGPDDQGEGYDMSQLVDRENSSNSGDGGAGSGGGGTASSGARTLKRPRLVWTPQLHKRFVDAVSHLGIKNAVPKTIMQLMNVEGLTRENVASHLQKYRLYLRRVQQGNLFSTCGNSPTRSTLGPGLDHGHHHALIGSPATGSSDHLFSSSEIPLASGDHHQQTRSLHLLSGSINHLVHQHMPGALLQPAVSQHQFNQAMAAVKSPPLFNIAPHLDPRHYTANMISPSPAQKTAWPSLYTSTIDINPSHRMENHSTPAGPPSPPQQALTLFPH